MRILIVVILAIVAIGAAGIWALGEFGPMLAGEATDARAPLVREPELVAANNAAPEAPTPNDSSTLSSTPARPVPAPPPAPAPVTATPQSAESAPAEPPAAAAPAPSVAPPQAERLDAQAARARLAPAPAETTSASPATPPPPPAPVAAADPVVAPAAVPDTAAASGAVGASTAAAAGVTPSLASQFKSRKVTYNRPPAKLALNKAIDVSLVINATDDANAGADALQGFPGTVVERDVDLSDTVSAQLTGVGFDITSQTVERQKLSGKTINRWQWRVTPTEIGTRTLILEIFGYESGSLDAEPLDAYRDEITVEVQQLDQMINWAKSVQPIFAVLAALAGAASALLAFLRFREEKKRGKTA